MTTIRIDTDLSHDGFDFTVLSAIVDDETGTVSSVDVRTPDASVTDWDPQTGSSYPTAEILAEVTRVTGRKVDLIDGQNLEGVETWTLHDLGAAR